MRTIHKLMDLTGRVALITGGAGYLGATIGETLAELGAAVVILDLDLNRAKAVAKSISANHKVEAMPLAVDLTDTGALGAVPDTVLSQFKNLDILVNCAALVGTSKLEGWTTPFEAQSVETWRAAFEVNLTAPFVLTQACVPSLKSSGHGSIINICSIYGVVGPDWRLYGDTGLGNPAAYAATKGGLVQFTRWLATTLAPAIRVNAITPGGVYRNHSEAFLSSYVTRTPLRRMATEEDMKGAVAYLASDLSAYVTGHNLVVDGGWTVW